MSGVLVHESFLLKLRMIITKRCYRLWRKRTALFILIVFCASCYISVLKRNPISLELTKELVESELEEVFKEDIPSECEIADLDSFSSKSTKVNEQIPDISCNAKDWVKCFHSQCKMVTDMRAVLNNIMCTYYDIIYKSDDEFSFGPPTHVEGNNVYTLVKSDHVKVACTARDGNGEKANWTYYSTGFRNSVKQKSPSPGRENTPNILILMFHSTSRNDFINRLPKSYNYLTKTLNGTIFKGYNIVGKGTPGALFPILTGKIEHELPYIKKDSNNNRSLDSTPFLFYQLKDDGYRTAYFEDMPWLGTFRYQHNRFHHQPTDHYLQDFFMEEAWNSQRVVSYFEDARFCVGDILQYQLMLSKVYQFSLLGGKRFSLTLITDLTYGKLNNLSVADDDLVEFLQMLMKQLLLQDTLLLIMGDHGRRYDNMKHTLFERLEERRPFLSVILPENLKRRRPGVEKALEDNVNIWTTPYDIHATILDALDLPQHVNRYKLPGAHIPRSMSLLKYIPKNRTCWEAGIEPQWCTCFAWKNVSTNDTLSQRAAKALIRHINLLTKSVRKKCLIRSLIFIEWVKKYQVNEQMLNDFVEISKETYQIRIVAGPRKAIYEASMTHMHRQNRFLVDLGLISRIDAYGNEGSCMSDQRPHLNKFCHCKQGNQTIG